MTPIGWLATWVLVAIIASPFIGDWLAGRREDAEPGEPTDIVLDRDQLIEAEKRDIKASRPRLHTTEYADAITRDDLPFACSEQDQPHLPRAS